MAKKETALAEQEAIAETSVPKVGLPDVLTGVTITRIRRDGIDYPALIYRGEAPKKGTKVRAKLANGITYSGIVCDATEADGETLIELRDGLKPEA